MIKVIRFLYIHGLKRVLFCLNPEKVHDRFIAVGDLFSKSFIIRKIFSFFLYYKDDSLKQEILGMTFENPVGLSAGFDKDGRIIELLPSLGFGYTQVGTVTLYPYKGNSSPMTYRLPKSQSLVVYYGLKNHGIEIISKRLQKINKDSIKNFPISISIGKTNSDKTADLNAGIKDYMECIKVCEKDSLGDFYTINVSCPNTFGGEPFTTPDRLEKLLKEINELKIEKPIFLKLPINLDWGRFRNLLDIILKYNISGVIIGNLNKDRSTQYLKDQIPAHVKGSLSGMPTQELSNNLISKTYQYCGDKLIIVGVGGIFSAEDAYEKIKRGSSLVQLITGMIYNGPQLISEINHGLVELLEKDGYSNITQAIGAFHKK